MGRKIHQSRIVIIGAGSADFGPKILSDLLQEPVLAGMDLRLVDIDEGALRLMEGLARRMNDEWGAGCRITATTERRAALPGASVVIVSIARERERRWFMDWDIPRRFGLRQPLGENGGPAAFFHGARNIGPFLEICRDMESLCPSALLLNFTNPVPRMVLAARRHSRIRAVGLCHQIFHGMEILSRWLRMPAADLEVTAAGLNHFTWFLSLRHRPTGTDLYPRLARAAARVPAGDNPLSRRLYGIFSLFPTAGDSHLSEYLPYCHDPATRPWVKYRLPLYPWTKMEARRTRLRKSLAAAARGRGTLDAYRTFSGERAAPVIASMLRGDGGREIAINLPNTGSISNLPDDAIVEVPARVRGSGPEGIPVGPLPEGIASLCRRQIDISRLAVDAAVRGDRSMALQALALDPMISDLDAAENIFNALTRAHREMLPRFR